MKASMSKKSTTRGPLPCDLGRRESRTAVGETGHPTSVCLLVISMYAEKEEEKKERGIGEGREGEEKKRGRRRERGKERGEGEEKKRGREGEKERKGKREKEEIIKVEG